MKNILFDTDTSGDCDDTGALAVLHSFASKGEARLLACVVNGRDEDASAGAVVWAINSYCGREEIPVGTYQGEAKKTKSHFTRAVRERFAPDYLDDLHLPTALEVYRHTLAAAKESSVTIASTGFLHNLRDLLDSGPDKWSALSGIDLARQKVKEIVIMGGAFPTSRTSEPEYNFSYGGFAPITRAVLERWPTPIIFSGFEIGLPIITGTSLAGLPDNPVRMAYELFKGETGSALKVGRPSWDQTVAWVAVRGTSGLWNLSEPGICRMFDDGHNEWRPDKQGSHVYLTAALPVESIAELIEKEMMAMPLLRAA